jgi:hypothetical protein
MQKSKVIKLIGLLLLCSLISAAFTEFIWERKDVYKIQNCESYWVSKSDNINWHELEVVCEANKFSNNGNEINITLTTKSLGLLSIGDKIKIIKK